jgi:hypothetical protein
VLEKQAGAPSVQAFVQHEAELGGPLQTEQVAVVQLGQALAVAVQTWALVPDKHVVPTALGQQAPPLHCPLGQGVVSDS